MTTHSTTTPARTPPKRLADSRLSEMLFPNDIAALLGYTGNSRLVLARRVMRASGVSRVLPGTKKVFVFRDEFEDHLESDATLESPIVARESDRRRGRRRRPEPLDPMPIRPDFLLA
jgi:hypothetical protein